MKKTFLVLFLNLIIFPCFGQEDLGMFETDTTYDILQEKPNIGQNARKVDKVKFSSALPSMNVSMGDSTAPGKPFANQKMQHTTAVRPVTGVVKTTSKVSSNLSTPIDFAAQSGKSIEIISNEPQKTSNVQVTEQKPAKDIAKESTNKQQATFPISLPDPKKAESFNIADIYLGMQPEDVIETVAESGFELTNVAYGIPSFMITDFDRSCREGGLTQMRLIHECIREAARSNEVYYVSQLAFERLDSKEKIIVLFSSALTDNKAFKIDYTAYGDNSLGTSYKDLLKKTHRRDIFWKYVYDKYGKPANKEFYFWGNPKKVYLKAFLEGNAMNGRIVLEDVEQTGIDYTQAETEDKEKDVNNPFHF